MQYIIFDMEFNQDFESDQTFTGSKASYPFEIIQIGAVKMDADFQILSTFNRYIRPTIYSKISPYITELTHITTEQLSKEETFPEVYQAFLIFIGDPESIFCTWGKTDMKELYHSAEYFKLDRRLLPKQFINIQPYASLHLKQPKKKLLRLQSTVEALNLPLPYSFHDASNDAYYTAEVFKKIYQPSMSPTSYDPIYINRTIITRQPKRSIDFDALLKQFEKMYGRPMTEDEQGIIKLSYQMGKTGQFIKSSNAEK
jgi:inhibitor of KinA sporulation pathway (predicted exonuclease)